MLFRSTPNGEGDYTPSDLFDILADAYSYLFLDVEAGQLPTLRKHVTANIDKLLGHIRRQFGGSRVSSPFPFPTCAGSCSGQLTLAKWD